MTLSNDVFDETIIGCRKCKRLVEYAKETLEIGKKKEFLNEYYWCKPVPSFGSLESEILIVGLAPGKHGAGRTGRPFTGDYAGEILYKALYEAGFSNSEVAIIPKCGHMILLEQADQALAILKKFIISNHPNR